MKVIKAPKKFYKDYENGPHLFLAGSIEMGKAEDWQTRLTDALKQKKGIILNPRRDDWDSSWEQKIDNEQFREQVEWELRAQEEADLMAVYFDPGTRSPITLMELGMFKDKKRNMIVYCPEGFWRKGNVDIACRKYGMISCTSWDDFVIEIKGRLY